MVKGILFFSFALIAGGIAYSVHLGALSTMQVVEEDIGPLHLLYIDQVGEYKQTGQSIQKISKELSKFGIPQRTGFGIYKDNPDKVKRENLRSEAGVVLTDEDLAKVKEIKGDFKYKVFEKTKAMTVKFPFKSALSIFLGVLKAYPALGKFANERHYEPTYAIEIYEPQKQIIYAMPVSLSK